MEVWRTFFDSDAYLYSLLFVFLLSQVPLTFGHNLVPSAGKHKFGLPLKCAIKTHTNARQ